MLQSLEFNPEYGTGYFHRRILIDCSNTGYILALVEDNPHAFALRLEYKVSNGRAFVSKVKARWQRHPTGACSGAVDAIETLTGCPLDNNVLAHHQHTNSRTNCTHFFDTSGILIRHAWLQWQKLAEPIVDYKILLPDSHNSINSISLTRNDKEVLKWTIENSTRIVEPKKYRGLPAVKGLTKWAKQYLSGDELEYCVILQKSLFISTVRHINIKAYVGQPSLISRFGTSVCYATQPERIEQAVQLDSSKDYSHCPEDMIQFDFID